MFSLYKKYISEKYTKNTIKALVNLYKNLNCVKSTILKIINKYDNKLLSKFKTYIFRDIRS